MVVLLASFPELLDFALTHVIVVLVTHGVVAYVECQADGLRRILHVTSALDDVFWRDVEGGRTVFLFKATSEVALMIILPLDDSVDLIDEFSR
jgi:hypothetical protein